MKRKTVAHTNSSKKKKNIRNKLKSLFINTPLNNDDLLINLGLYTRSSVFAKHLFLYEIYNKILSIPGNIHVYGTWWGQDLILLYNLREILEPHNVSRKLIGFDTFDGYRGIGKFDVKSNIINSNNYATGKNYYKYLNNILRYHEKENRLENLNKFQLIKGDISQTLKNYISKNPQEIIALAYFDLAIFKPTSSALSDIENNLVKGSCLVFDQLNNKDYPGETIALKKSKLFKNCKIINSRFLPDRTILIKSK